MIYGPERFDAACLARPTSYSLWIGTALPGTKSPARHRGGVLRSYGHSRPAMFEAWGPDTTHPLPRRSSCSSLAGKSRPRELATPGFSTATNTCLSITKPRRK